MFGYCKFKGIGILSYSPLMAGYLARPVGTQTQRSKNTDGSPFEKKRRDSDNEIIKRVEQLASKKSLKMSEVALAWSGLKVSSPIIGSNSVSLSRRCVSSLTN
jgi:aryl-alcohol dehydrogenase-like predicted oxidoreductase